MTVIRIIAFVIFVISCVTIYHNTNSFEPIKRIIYIALGMVVMFVITTVICNIKISGITIENEEALKETVNVMKIIFIPINAMIGLSPIGNVLGKLKDKVIELEKAKKRLIIILVIFVLMLIFEANYIGNFITDLLG